MLAVLRLNHRIGRDKRLSTHVALVARAFGADEIYYSGEYDGSLEQSVVKVVEKWGGSFRINYVSSWRSFLKTWQGKTVHLTMYGLPLKTVIDEIRNVFRSENLLVVVGGEKVDSDVYYAVDYNVAITSQPHSEAAALAVFLDWLYEGAELDRSFPDAVFAVVPSARGKKVIYRRSSAEADSDIRGYL
ncbi:MAG: tRNA (cytidine(56)-2'-O)-methyltransferase [Candidatus Caldarchaeum sp.]|nr:tRNA (cytidine(56)-2'-O)-methyltransferase [Candidatus Caldarchaeum sp.]MDW8435791.1 tRNA (cytidine(56)-2'-O)-methyltransferase [Candidatus Caldarchaeum sp.]